MSFADDDEDAIFGNVTSGNDVQNKVENVTADHDEASIFSVSLSSPVKEAPKMTGTETAVSSDPNSPQMLGTLQSLPSALAAPEEVTGKLPMDQSFLENATVHIKETEKHTEDNPGGLGDYITYLVEIRPVEGAPVKVPYSSLWRRFSEFDMLKDYFTASYPYVIVPVIPSKTLNRLSKNIKANLMQGHKAAYSQTDRIENSVPTAPNVNSTIVETRRIELEKFLNACARHPALSHSQIFWQFLQDQTGFKPAVESTGYKHKLPSTVSIDKNLLLDGSPYTQTLSIESTLKEFLAAYQQNSLAELSVLNVYQNYSRVFQLIAEIQPMLRKEFSLAAPVMGLLVGIAEEAQLKESRGAYAQLKNLERTARKSIHYGQAAHYARAQSDTRNAEQRLHETKTERAELSAGNIPKSMSSFRGIGSMLKAVVETNIEREARAKKLERREALEEQLCTKSIHDFSRFKTNCAQELDSWHAHRQEVSKQALIDMVQNRLQRLKKTRDTWKEVYDIMQ